MNVFWLGGAFNFTAVSLAKLWRHFGGKTTILGRHAAGISLNTSLLNAWIFGGSAASSISQKCLRHLCQRWYFLLRADLLEVVTKIKQDGCDIFFFTCFWLCCPQGCFVFKPSPKKRKKQDVSQGEESQSVFYNGS